ncbi:MAG: ribosome silencing factor [Planctomycetota bacterium]|nr:MAG: ribosome silencing factor [Planctomycetota bacterium]
MNDQKFAVACARILDSHKASDIVILDVAEVFLLASYFVIATARNQRHLRALADELDTYLKENEKQKLGVEGRDEGGWLLFDIGDVIVHVFLEDDRELYDLEMLWGDAPQIKYEV